MTVFPDLVDSLPKKVDLVRNQLWLRRKSDILVLAMEYRNLQKSCNVNMIKRFVSMGYRIGMWFAINFLRLFLENSRKSTNFAPRFSRESLAIPSARLRIRRLYANHMLRICETYIFAENIMSYIWLTYKARNFVEVHEDERENRQRVQLTTTI